MTPIEYIEEITWERKNFHLDEEGEHISAISYEVIRRNRKGILKLYKEEFYDPESTVLIKILRIKTLRAYFKRRYREYTLTLYVAKDIIDNIGNEIFLETEGEQNER